MDLILIRHAEAEPADGKADAARQLTDRGHQHAARLAEALAKHFRPAVVVSSPYIRAVQTAAPLAAGQAVAETELLLPEAERFKKLTAWLTDRGDGPVAAVGHNPSLSFYLAWLLGAEDEATPMAKAAAAGVRLERAGKGGGKLLWLVTPDWCCVFFGS